MRQPAASTTTLGCLLALLPFAACGGEGSGEETRLDTDGGHVTPETHRIEIRAMQYQPDHLDVSPGDTVIWFNQDLVPHTVTAEDGSWDSGPMAQGQRWRLIVGPEGATHYACAFHPTMEGRLKHSTRPRTHGGKR